MKTPFLSPWGVGRSTNLEDSQLINLYAEIVETKDGKEPGAFYMCPGLDLIGTAETSPANTDPVRGFLVFQGLLYIVSGQGVFTGTPAPNVLLGLISTSSGPVSMICNTTQIAIFDGVNGYLIESGVLSVISLPFPNPVSATFQDGFGLVNQGGSNKWWQSDLNDLSIWDPLNFSSADAEPDNIVAVADIHQEVWLLKQSDVEVWSNAGLPGFAFQRIQGVFLEVGCAAAFSVSKVGESLCWLSQNEQGQGIVIMATGYQPRTISTQALTRRINSYSTIADAIGYSYQQDGHLFYVLTFPTGNETWCYDVTASAFAGIPMWHQRAAFANGQFSRHWSNACVFYNGQTIVGDYRSGNLYVLDLEAQTDALTRRKWLHTWRALSQPTLNPTRFNSLTIDMQTGIGVQDAENPLCVLRWSDDGGHNWSNERFMAVGKVGETARRVIFKRLGSTRRNSGLDRIFELSSTDFFDVALMGADIE